VQNGAAKHVVVSTLGPGSLGGDTVRMFGCVGAGAHLIVSAQSATRVYGPGLSSLVSRWIVADEATLELRLHPLLLFAHGRYEATTEIELASGARLRLIDAAALAEDEDASAKVVTVVRRAGRLGLRDAMLLDARTLARGAVGTLVAYGLPPCEDSQCDDGVRAGDGTTLDGGTFIRVRAPSIWKVTQALEEACKC